MKIYLINKSFYLYTESSKRPNNEQNAIPHEIRLSFDKVMRIWILVSLRIDNFTIRIFCYDTLQKNKTLRIKSESK